MTGPLSVRIAAPYTNVVPACEVSFTARIEGRTTASEWDFGDGAVVSNRPYATHAWGALGDYAVVLRVYNESYPGGVSATVTMHVVEQQVHYVAADSANPLPPYTSWATAATNLQDAVDIASVAGSLVLVGNGTYATGGRAVYATMTNRVAVTKPLTLWSVNGPGLTVIDGTGSVRCVYLANGASLSGFTLTNGLADNGGGVWCQSATAVVSNCTLTGNRAPYGGGAYGGTLNNCTLTGNDTDGIGGGAYGGTLNNCTLTGNSAWESGGGAFECTLNNCSLTGNWIFGYGGGAYGGTLNNCTLTGNSAHYAGGGAYGATLNNCTLTNNEAQYGGGAYECTLYNCTLIGNSANDYFDGYGGYHSGGDGGGAYACTLYNCTLSGNRASSPYDQHTGGGAHGGR